MLGVDQPATSWSSTRRAEDMVSIPTALPDTVDAVRPGGKIGEHRTRLVDPRAR
jgi:hypothetical protein